MCKRRKIVFCMMSNFKVLSLADDRATLRNDERKKNKNKNAKKPLRDNQTNKKTRENYSFLNEKWIKILSTRKKNSFFFSCNFLFYDSQRFLPPLLNRLQCSRFKIHRIPHADLQARKLSEPCSFPLRRRIDVWL